MRRERLGRAGARLLERDAARSRRLPAPVACRASHPVNLVVAAVWGTASRDYLGRHHLVAMASATLVTARGARSTEKGVVGSLLRNRQRGLTSDRSNLIQGGDTNLGVGTEAFEHGGRLWE